MRNMERCSLKENRNRFFRIVVFGRSGGGGRIVVQYMLFWLYCKRKAWEKRKKIRQKYNYLYDTAGSRFWECSSVGRAGPF